MDFSYGATHFEELRNKSDEISDVVTLLLELPFDIDMIAMSDYTRGTLFS